MRRTTLKIDEKKLARAQRVLGTSGVQDTIDRALEEVLRAHLRSRLAGRIHSGKGIDRGEAILAASGRSPDNPSSGSRSAVACPSEGSPQVEPG